MYLTILKPERCDHVQDIENIKSAILSAGNIELSNYHLATDEQKQALTRIEDKAIKWIPQLITTIESLQDEKVIQSNRIMTLEDWHSNLLKTHESRISETLELSLKVESQKEEIEKLSATVAIYKDQDRWKANFEKVYTEREIEIGRHAGTKIKLDSQKAITELAVKALGHFALESVYGQDEEYISSKAKKDMIFRAKMFLAEIRSKDV